MPVSPSIGLLTTGRAGSNPGAGSAQFTEFSSDCLEPGEVRVVAMRGRPLSLQHDFLDGAACRGQIGNLEQARQAELLDADLRLVVTDEHALFSNLLAQSRQALEDPVIQMPLARVVLR